MSTPTTVSSSISEGATRRLTRSSKPCWEALVEKLEYNMPAWNASNWVVKHNLKIIRNIQHIQDFETRKRPDPPPFSFSELLNPRRNARAPAAKHNAGIDRLAYLFDSLKQYEPGHAPAQNYEPVFITTRALILLLKKCADVYGRRPEEQQLSRSLEMVYALQNFLEDSATLRLTRQEYDARLDAMREQLVEAFTENFLLFETLEDRRRAAQTPAPVTRADLRDAVKTILRGEDVNAAKPGPRLNAAKKRQIEAAEAWRSSHAGCSLHNACLRSFVPAKGGYKSADALYSHMHRQLKS